MLLSSRVLRFLIMCRNSNELLVLVTLCCSPLLSQPSERQALDWETVLSWLPTDTETLVVASQPFPLPILDTKSDRRVLTTALQCLTVSEIAAYEKVYRPLVGRKVLFAMKGSRNFRMPRRLGMGSYDGATIIVFAESIHDFVDTFLKGMEHEVILDSRVYTFLLPNREAPRDKPEDFKLFVAHPRPNVVISATDRGYLRELLERRQRKGLERAFGSSLPEWKFVDPHSPVWAIRHYRRELNSQDLTSPFWVGAPVDRLDHEAAGLVFSAQPPGKPARLYYLSGSKRSASIARSCWERLGLSPTVQQNEPGATEIVVPMDSDRAENSFLFLLLTALGHIVAV